MNTTATLTAAQIASIDHSEHLDRMVHFFETISPENVSDLAHIYAFDVYFKDPFNEVKGILATTKIFKHMFTQVNNPRFIVTSRILQGDNAFLVWDFVFTMKRFSSEVQTIRGASHIRFDNTGVVVYHRDYWDAAEELYEKLPVLGGLMRLLKKSART
jgi:steroid Delta-isomerase